MDPVGEDNPQGSTEEQVDDDEDPIIIPGRRTRISTVRMEMLSPCHAMTFSEAISGSHWEPSCPAV